MHKAAATVEAEALELPAGSDKMLESVLSLVSDEHKGMANTDELVLFLNVREIKKRSSEKGKGKGGKRAGKVEAAVVDNVVLNIAFGHLATLESTINGTRLCGIERITKLKTTLIGHMQCKGAELTSGMAPSSALERVVLRDLNRFGRR